MIIIFILGYLGIAFEHNVKIDKLIPALLMMVFCWAVIALGGMEVFEVIPGEGLKLVHENHGEEPYVQVLLHHLGKTAEILVFLLGAMTIVEIIDNFNGFASINQFVKTRNKKKLLWIVAFLAFFLSAIIDNLTATIVLITILNKLISDTKLKLWFAGLIVISANAGGAWSPIGDVTTTMLWIAHKVEVGSLFLYLFIPSLVCMLIPVLVTSRLPIFKGEINPPEDETDEQDPFGFKMLCIGLAMIVSVPIFKVVTHLPPYVGMMLALAVVATVAEFVSQRRFSLTTLSDEDHSYHSPVHHALTRIEMPSILFFLGILLAVAALESLGTLFHLAQVIDKSMPEDLVVIILGFLSAMIDNVPLVAASIGMFDHEPDSPFWHFIAYAAGTGGSMLIIGSAAGVVAMGLQKIDFMWYLKKIAWLALIGYLAGIVIFMLLRDFVIHP